ncbi:MAG: DUF4184 family protein [Nocardioides sp.]
MPFTRAHPAAVLPFRRSRLPMAALVAGSLVPRTSVSVSFSGWGTPTPGRIRG